MPHDYAQGINRSSLTSFGSVLPGIEPDDARPPSRVLAHDSRSMRFATPSS
jgi:hypothetical protein